MANEALLQATAVTRRFSGPAAEVHAVDGVDLSIHQGDYTVLRGPSGCGKSTLLMLLGGLRRPSDGTVRFRSLDLYSAPASTRRQLRAGPIAYVFQEMYLLPYLDALSNVALALRERPRGVARDTASHALDALGLGSRLTHRPSQLSAGERQRVAVARALVRKPEVILADEPTGSLDPEGAAKVQEQFQQFHADGGTVVLVTHAEGLCLPKSARSLSMRAGKIEP